MTGSAQEHQHNTSNIPLNNVQNTNTKNTIYTYYDNNKEKIKIELIGKINDQITTLLLDTGANVTVINKNTIKCNKLNTEGELYLETANNSKLNILGTTMAQIKIGTIVINHKIIVVDNLCTPVIIGLDIMKKINTILDLKNDLLTFNYEGIEVKLKIEQEAKPINTLHDTNNNQHNKHVITNFQQFLFQKTETYNTKCRYHEIIGNLFTDQTNDAIAHCVSKDFKMSAGIAQQFKEKFEDVDVLKAQSKKLTEIAFLKKNKQWILYLITKHVYNDKPTYEDILTHYKI